MLQLCLSSGHKHTHTHTFLNSWTLTDSSSPDEKLDLNDSKWEDIHVTTGALKMFFRELPEPLFTYSSFHDFVNAISEWLNWLDHRVPRDVAILLCGVIVAVSAPECSDYKQRVNTVKDLIKKMPKPNQDTMQILFKHLRR